MACGVFVPSELVCDKDKRTVECNPAPLDAALIEKPALADDPQEPTVLDWIFGAFKRKQYPGPDEIALPGLSLADWANESDRVIVKKNGPVHIAYYKAQETSVLIDTGGSGFIISGEGLIATASHVVPDGASMVHADTVDGTKYVAEMISRDVNNDLALLKITAVNQNRGFPFLKLNTKDAYGEELAITGHPHRWPSVYVSLGKAYEKPYKSISTWKNSNDLLKILAHTEGGNSGGAVVDFIGDVRGVLVGGSYDNSISIVVPSKNVENLVKWTERAVTQKIVDEGGYHLGKPPEVVAKMLAKPENKVPGQDKVPNLEITASKKPPDQLPKIQPPKEQPPKDQPATTPKEQLLPNPWIKSPAPGSFVSPYGKIIKDKMNYYEQKKAQ